MRNGGELYRICIQDIDYLLKEVSGSPGTRRCAGHATMQHSVRRVSHISLCSNELKAICWEHGATCDLIPTTLGAVLTLKLRQLFTQRRCFGAVLGRFDMRLDCAGGAHGLEGFAYEVLLPLVHMFELVGDVVLLHGIGFKPGNLRAQKSDVMALLRLHKSRIVNPFVDSVLVIPSALVL